MKVASNLIPLSESDRSELVNALRVAAERFIEHQSTVMESSLYPEAAKRLKEQFALQTANCLRMADMFDATEEIYTSPVEEPK